MILFSPARTGDEIVDRNLDALARSLRSLGVFVDAVVLVSQAIATTDTRVRHGLGHAIRGYFIVKSPADVRVFDGATPEATDPLNFVTLRLSSAQTVTLAVF